MFRIVYYTTRRGDRPVEDFILTLKRKTAVKTAAFIEWLAEKGPGLHRPYSDHVRGPIRELRVQFSHEAVRILYFFQFKEDVVLLHGFLKKDMLLRQADIRLAEERMEDWVRRQGGK